MKLSFGEITGFVGSRVMMITLPVLYLFRFLVNKLKIT